MFADDPGPRGGRSDASIVVGGRNVVLHVHEVQYRIGRPTQLSGGEPGTDGPHSLSPTANESTVALCGGSGSARKTGTR
jgi:hypothetical protein